jgi:hypothetical protein
MATDSAEPTATGAGDGTRSVLLPDARALLYGLAGAGAVVALVSGVRSYLEYADGTADPFLDLVGVLVSLTLGFTLLAVALGGAVALGVSHALSERT